MMKSGSIRIMCRLLLLLPAFMFVSSAVQGDGKSRRQFVVTLDEASGTLLSTSQAEAAASGSTDSPEHRFGVSLKEEFRSDELRYGILEAESPEELDGYLAALDVSPTDVIETEFTNGPALGGGPIAGATPKDGHRIYVIERGVPGISAAPMEKMKEISQGSQSVVEQFGESLEWDRSFLTREGTFCVYRTDDESKIREHAAIAGFPADRITEVDHVVHDYAFR